MSSISIFFVTVRWIHTWNNFRAINKVFNVMADNWKFQHSSREFISHSILVQNKPLPETGSSWVSCQSVVGLKPDLPCKSGLHFSLVSSRSREASPTQLSFNKELGVKNTRGRIKRCSRNARINVIGSSDWVRGKESDNFCRGESCISKSRKDRVDSILRKISNETEKIIKQLTEWLRY